MMSYWHSQGEGKNHLVQCQKHCIWGHGYWFSVGGSQLIRCAHVWHASTTMKTSKKSRNHCCLFILRTVYHRSINNDHSTLVEAPLQPSLPKRWPRVKESPNSTSDTLIFHSPLPMPAEPLHHCQLWWGPAPCIAPDAAIAQLSGLVPIHCFSKQISIIFLAFSFSSIPFKITPKMNSKPNHKNNIGWHWMIGRSVGWRRGRVRGMGQHLLWLSKRKRSHHWGCHLYQYWYHF